MNGPAWKPAVEPTFKIPPRRRSIIPGKEQSREMRQGGDVHLDHFHLPVKVEFGHRPQRAEPGVVHEHVDRHAVAIN